MRLSLRKAQSMLRRTTSMWIVPRRHSADALEFRSSMAIRSRSRCCVSGVTVSARPSSHMPKRSMTMTRSRMIFVRRFRRQTSLRIGLGIYSRICEMQSDGRPKKRCVHGSPSTGYQAPDSQIPVWHQVPKGNAFLSVCAKPVWGPQQTWHGLSPNSIDPSRIRKANAALVRSWCFSDLSRCPACVRNAHQGGRPPTSLNLWVHTLVRPARLVPVAH